MAALPKGHADDTMLVFLSKDLNEISEHATDVAAVVMFAGDCKEITSVLYYPPQERADRMSKTTKG